MSDDYTLYEAVLGSGKWPKAVESGKINSIIGVVDP